MWINGLVSIKFIPKKRNYSGAIEIASIGLKPNVRLRGQSDF
jgi:hypothetical protein